MPKRNAQARIERYARKIRKIEEREKRRRIISPFDSSSEDEGNEVPNHNTDCEIIPDQISITPDIATEQNLSENVEQINDQSDLSLQAESPTKNDLDPELLSALGESTSESPEYGDSIHDNLSKLWLPLLKKGMPKESKDKTLKEYLIPDNCRLLQAPKLNAEISAAIPDMVRNRDKTIVASQQQLGLGITAINRGLDVLLKSDNKIQAMKHFSNGCRLLCDSHSLMSKNRIKLIMPSLDRTFLHMIAESERDETLFGSSLSEKIKAAKAIEKQSLQIKKPILKPQKSTAAQPTGRSGSHQGNWGAPPRYPSANRGGRGGYRRPQMASTVRRQYNAPTTQPLRAATLDKPRALAQNHH